MKITKTHVADFISIVLAVLILAAVAVFVSYNITAARINDYENCKVTYASETMNKKTCTSGTTYIYN
jgi:uncharacterized protein YxeA